MTKNAKFHNEEISTEWISSTLADSRIYSLEIRKIKILDFYLIFELYWIFEKIENQISKMQNILIIPSFEDQNAYFDNPKCLFSNLDESWFLHFELISTRPMIFWALLQQFLRVVFVLYKMEVVLLDRNSMFQGIRSTLDRSSLQVGPWCFFRSHGKIPKIGVFRLRLYTSYKILPFQYSCSDKASFRRSLLQ